MLTHLLLTPLTTTLELLTTLTWKHCQKMKFKPQFFLIPKVCKKNLLQTEHYFQI